MNILRKFQELSAVAVVVVAVGDRPSFSGRRWSCLEQSEGTRHLRGSTPPSVAVFRSRLKEDPSILYLVSHPSLYSAHAVTTLTLLWHVNGLRYFGI